MLRGLQYPAEGMGSKRPQRNGKKSGNSGGSEEGAVGFHFLMLQVPPKKSSGAGRAGRSGSLKGTEILCSFPLSLKERWPI